MKCLAHRISLPFSFLFLPSFSGLFVFCFFLFLFCYFILWLASLDRRWLHVILGATLLSCPEQSRGSMPVCQLNGIPGRCSSRVVSDYAGYAYRSCGGNPPSASLPSIRFSCEGLQQVGRSFFSAALICRLNLRV